MEYLYPQVMLFSYSKIKSRHKVRGVSKIYFSYFSMKRDVLGTVNVLKI